MMKLEKMDDFFAARIDGYAEHMKRDIKGASGFYAYTASPLPLADGSRVLDRGVYHGTCGVEGDCRNDRNRTPVPSGIHAGRF